MVRVSSGLSEIGHNFMLNDMSLFINQATHRAIAFEKFFIFKSNYYNIAQKTML